MKRGCVCVYIPASPSPLFSQWVKGCYEVNLGFIHSGHTQTQRTCHILSPDAQWHGPLVGGQFNFSLPSVAAYSGSYASCWQAAGFMSHKKKKTSEPLTPHPLNWVQTLRGADWIMKWNVFAVLHKYCWRLLYCDKWNFVPFPNTCHRSRGNIHCRFLGCAGHMQDASLPLLDLAASKEMAAC